MPDAPDYTNRRHFAVSRLLQARIGGFTFDEYELLKAQAAEVKNYEPLRWYKVTDNSYTDLGNNILDWGERHRLSSAEWTLKPLPISGNGGGSVANWKSSETASLPCLGLCWAHWSLRA